jgi:WD40 repeat protein
VPPAGSSPGCCARAVGGGTLRRSEASRLTAPRLRLLTAQRAVAVGAILWPDLDLDVRFQRGQRVRHLIVTVHGIRTYGWWQERLEALIKAREPETRVFNYHFGYFSVAAFMVPPLRWLLTRRFHAALIKEVKSESWDRIDIVAHSFGTHLVAWALHGIAPDKRPRIHTIILAGSVLKPNFPWQEWFDRHLTYLVNDCGIRDSVLVLNQLFVLFTGMAGRVGFKGMTNDRFRNRYFNFGHSGYFQKGDTPYDDFLVDKWLPLLLSDSAPAVFDERKPLGAIGGLVIFCLNNLEPIKLLVYVIVLATPAVYYYKLHQDAEWQRAKSVARELAGYSRAHLRDDPELSLLLALHSLATTSHRYRAVVAEAEDALHSALVESHIWRTLQPPATVKDIAWTSRGSEIVVRARDGAADAWYAASGQKVAGAASLVGDALYRPPQRSFKLAGSSASYAAPVSADGKRLATTDWHSVDIRDASGDVLKHMSYLGISLAWAPAGSALAIGDYYGVVTVVDAVTGDELKRLAGHKGYVARVAWSPDAKWLATASADGTVKIWMLTTEELPGIPAAGQVHEVAWQPKRNELAAIVRDSAKTWNAETGKERVIFSDPKGYLLSSLAWNPGGTRLAIGTSDALVLYDPASGDVFTIPTKPVAEITGLAWSPDGRVLATACSEKVWEPKTGGHNVKLLDMEAGGRELMAVPTSEGQASRIAWSPDGKWVAVGTLGGWVNIWNAKTGGDAKTLIKNQDSVYGLSWSADSKRLALSTVNLGPSIWDVETGKKVIDLYYDHRSVVNDIAWSPDSLRIATADDDGSVGIWDPSNGSELFRLRGATGRLSGVAWSGDGQRLVSWGNNGLLRQYAMGIEISMILARSRTTRDLTSAECQKYLHTAQCPSRP